MGMEPSIQAAILKMHPIHQPTVPSVPHFLKLSVRENGILRPLLWWAGRPGKRPGCLKIFVHPEDFEIIMACSDGAGGFCMTVRTLNQLLPDRFGLADQVK